MQSLTRGLTKDQGALLRQVPEDGTAIGNVMLRKKLRWRSERYYNVRDSLVDNSYLVLGRGRGGSVRRNVAPAISAEDEFGVDSVEHRLEVQHEFDLYAPTCKVLNDEWAKDHRINPVAVEITALKGSRLAGIWSKPDITSVQIRTFPYVPGKHLEVVTFEVKPVTAINVYAVYEALAHRRAATHSYVLLHIPPGSADILENDIQGIAETARLHGIGVITVGDPEDYQSWDEREPAQRVEPDPVRLNEFIGGQLSEGARETIASWLR